MEPANLGEATVNDPVDLAPLCYGDTTESVFEVISYMDTDQILDGKLDVHCLGFGRLSQRVLNELMRKVVLNGVGSSGVLPADTAPKVLDIVLGAGANAGYVHYGAGLFSWAVLSGNTEMVQHVLLRGAVLNKRNSFYIINALRNNNLQMVQLLLDLDVDVPTYEKDDSCLLHAVATCIARGETHLLEMLVARGLDLPNLMRVDDFAAVLYEIELRELVVDIYVDVDAWRRENGKLTQLLDSLSLASTAFQFLIPLGISESTDRVLKALVEQGCPLTMAVFYAALTNAGIKVEFPVTISFGSNDGLKSSPQPLSAYGIRLFVTMVRRAQHGTTASNSFLHNLESFINGCPVSTEYPVPRLVDLAVRAMRGQAIIAGRNLRDTLTGIAVPKLLISYILLDDLLDPDRLEQDLLPIYDS